MLIDDERNIAVAAVHMGGLSLDVLRKLRDRQIERPVQLERRHRAGARGVQLLDGMQKTICGRYGEADSAAPIEGRDNDAAATPAPLSLNSCLRDIVIV